MSPDLAAIRKMSSASADVIKQSRYHPYRHIATSTCLSCNRLRITWPLRTRGTLVACLGVGRPTPRLAQIKYVRKYCQHTDTIFGHIWFVAVTLNSDGALLINESLQNTSYRWNTAHRNLAFLLLIKMWVNRTEPSKHRRPITNQCEIYDGKLSAVL